MMNKFILGLIKKSLFSLFAAIVLNFSTLSPILAADIENTSTASLASDQSQIESGITAGPRGTVGPDETAIGPRGATGPQEPTGPREATGAGTVSEIAAANTATGPNSDNQNMALADNSTTVKSSNDAAVNNNASLTLNTGKNTVGENSAVGNVQTGNVNGSVNVINMANSTLGAGSSVGTQSFNGGGQIVLNPIGARTMLENNLTGPDSSNGNAVVNNNVVKVIDSNNANADNSLVINANTGWNSIFGNTKVGDILTGNVNIAANLINILNVYRPDLVLNLDIWTINGNHNGNIVFPGANTLTGAESANQNSLHAETLAGAKLLQNGNINNIFAFDTNTGNNSVGGSTVAGNIVTGEANTRSAVANIVNAGTPTIYLVNVFGNWDGKLSGVDPNSVIVNAANTVTGTGSANNNTADFKNDTEIQIQNNASANNKITIKANTGNNRVGNNTMAGNLKTGIINLTSNVVNILNSLSGKVGRFALGIVNIFGNWTGNATGAPTNTSNETKPAETQSANLSAATPQTSLAPAPAASAPAIIQSEESKTKTTAKSSAVASIETKQETGGHGQSETASIKSETTNENITDTEKKYEGRFDSRENGINPAESPSIRELAYNPGTDNIMERAAQNGKTVPKPLLYLAGSTFGLALLLGTLESLRRRSRSIQ